MHRPHTTVILAMSADGKISDFQHNPAHFGSKNDKKHLEKRISLVDGVLVGAGTLRAYGTTLPITNSELLQLRKQQGKPPQPSHIICSASGEISAKLRFFSQKVPRCLLTTAKGAAVWKNQSSHHFEEILTANSLENGKIDWFDAFSRFAELGLQKLAILGGGELVASLLEVDLIDEFWLTVCPLILGGVNAPTPVEGSGFLSRKAKNLELLSVETIEQEIFLHYRLHR